MTPTDEMIDEAFHRYCAVLGRAVPPAVSPASELQRSAFAAALSAALAVAPTVDGWVWCERHDTNGWSNPTQNVWCLAAVAGDNEPGVCPGPHRTLHIGGEA